LLCLHALETSICNPPPGRHTSRGENHLLRYVRADYPTAWDNLCGSFEGYKTCAAGNVQNLDPRLKTGQLEQGGLCRFELALPRTFILRGGSVPTVALNASLQLGIHLQKSSKCSITGSRSQCGKTVGQKLGSGVQIGMMGSPLVWLHLPFTSSRGEYALFP
jgi:hypothetical protein